MKLESNTGYVSSGVAGLDEVLEGGLTQGEMLLLQGTAGTGKTMLALQWAVDGVARGERVLYVAFGESRQELETIAATNGWDLAGLDLLESSAPEQEHTMFHPSEVELEKTLGQLWDELDRIKPTRLVIDSLTEIRLLSQNDLRYYRELLGMKRRLQGKGCTVLLLEIAAESLSAAVASGVICLEQFSPDYGGVRRRLSVTKLRGRSYLSGYHDFIIKRGGLQVFPRLIALEHRAEHEARLMPSGVESLDVLFGGGIISATSTLLVGVAGTGKSSIALSFAIAAADRGEKSALYTFEERPELIVRRARAVGMDIQGHLDAGLLNIRQVDPAELLPSQFTDLVRKEVEERDVAMLIIDSLNGYLHAMPQAQALMAQMHELLTYLGQCDVASLLVLGQSGILDNPSSPINASYLTDNLVWLRLFEREGKLNRSIAVVKQRGGTHKRTIHELHVGAEGLAVGQLLSDSRSLNEECPHGQMD